MLFFVCRQTAVERPLADWVGELYFEYHRGTYTTQAANKCDNRRGEELLHNVEFLATVAAMRHQMTYPRAEIQVLFFFMI